MTTPGETLPGTRTVVPHPLVHGLLIGGRDASVGSSVDAVVSLCASDDRWLGLEHVEFHLNDRDTGVGRVIEEAAQTVVDILEQGRAVYLHGDEARSRTPIVAARVAVLLGAEPEGALTSVRRALLAASPSPHLVSAYAGLPHPWAGVDVIDPLRLFGAPGRIDKQMLHLRGLLSDNNLFGGDDVNPDPLRVGPLARARGFLIAGGDDDAYFTVAVLWGGELGRSVAVRGWPRDVEVVESLLTACEGDTFVVPGTPEYVDYDRHDPLAVQVALLATTPVSKLLGDRPPGSVRGDPDRAASAEPRFCPACGRTHIAEVIVGMPTPDDNLDDPRSVFVGCLVTGDEPRWVCRDCKQEWGTQDRQEDLDEEDEEDEDDDSDE